MRLQIESGRMHLQRSSCSVTSVVSDSVQSHRRQPTRLPRPWDSPGKNTGMGCHFLLQCMKSKSEVAQSCQTLSDPMDCSPPVSSIHGIFQARVLEWGISPLWSGASHMPRTAQCLLDPGPIPGLGRSNGEGIGYPLQYSWACLVAQLVKNLPAKWETWV